MQNKAKHPPPKQKIKPSINTLNSTVASPGITVINFFTFFDLLFSIFSDHYNIHWCYNILKETDMF